ncbi:nickel-responsive transcriptional regulator NikR [uncultured Methylovirgula sp.]|uniref:nickel-responsive transcriptional regulator NikR n=1 Tax=uncultured Methylovirgula sp. TaxID=1285960 RepID=UPI00260850AC|nr:nickel-responsive transcriptional regulator NikR [uncultured Methylovirgula sp.]
MGAADIADERAGARKSLVGRVSLSLPEALVEELDLMVAKRGFASRSQAVAEILTRSLAAHHYEIGNEVMVGTITLFYDYLSTGVDQRLADLQRAYVDEVISSFHVHLANHRTLEVLLVQGPAHKLQAIADEMTALRGVVSGNLQVLAAIMPPIHPFIEA